jgi:hypothetical protein
MCKERLADGANQMKSQTKDPIKEEIAEELSNRRHRLRTAAGLLFDLEDTGADPSYLMPDGLKRLFATRATHEQINAALLVLQSQHKVNELGEDSYIGDEETYFARMADALYRSKYPAEVIYAAIDHILTEHGSYPTTVSLLGVCEQVTQVMRQKMIRLLTGDLIDSEPMPKEAIL